MRYYVHPIKLDNYGDPKTYSPYIEIKGKELVLYDKNDIEEKRLPISQICSAEIMNAAMEDRISGRTAHIRKRGFIVDIVLLIFGGQYIVFWDVDFTYLFSLHLCKRNFEAFKDFIVNKEKAKKKYLED